LSLANGWFVDGSPRCWLGACWLSAWALIRALHFSICWFVWQNVKWNNFFFDIWLFGGCFWNITQRMACMAQKGLQFFAHNNIYFYPDKLFLKFWLCFRKIKKN
jgi:hypothetical protein